MDAFPLLYPGTKAVFFPLNAIFLEAKNTKAKSYGFTNILDACYNGAVPGIAAPANAAVCSNPDQYIYWARAHADTLPCPSLLQPCRASPRPPTRPCAATPTSTLTGRAAMPTPCHAPIPPALNKD